MQRHFTLLSRVLLLACFALPSLAVQARVAAAKTAQGATPAPSSQPIDLNAALPAQLKTLPGIGDAYAKRIVEGRPYSAKNQLVTRGILPQATYERIKDGVVAHRVSKP